MHTKIIADLFEATKDLENWAEFHKVANLGPALAFCVEYDIIESNEKVEEIIESTYAMLLKAIGVEGDFDSLSDIFEAANTE
jgi:hypothetical protein